VGAAPPGVNRPLAWIARHRSTNDSLRSAFEVLPFCGSLWGGATCGGSALCPCCISRSRADGTTPSPTRTAICHIAQTSFQNCIASVFCFQMVCTILARDSPRGPSTRGSRAVAIHRTRLTTPILLSPHADLPAANLPGQTLVLGQRSARSGVHLTSACLAVVDGTLHLADRLAGFIGHGLGRKLRP
jgi:hypothetical protein